MRIKNEYKSLFLACLTYTATVFYTPHLHIFSQDRADAEQLSSDRTPGQVSIIKNDVSPISTISNIKASSFTIIFAETSTFFNTTQGFKSAFLSGREYFQIISLIKIGLRKIIFPYHSYW